MEHQQPYFCQAVGDYPGSNGWWDLQTLGYNFSKGHLRSQHQRICQSGQPCLTKILHTIERYKVPAAHIKNMLEEKLW